MHPKPTFSFTIPSLHDETPLDCRIYHPITCAITNTCGKRSLKVRGGIVAHPYTSFGGSYDDYVVLSVVMEMLEAGFVTGTFNFRGAGSSKGKASWTANPELSDYISFIGFFVTYLNYFEPCTSIPSLPLISKDASILSSSVFTRSPVLDSFAIDGSHMILVLGGYSYGSLITTYLPTVKSLLNRFRNASEGSTEARIRNQAIDLALRWNQKVHVLYKTQQCRTIQSQEKFRTVPHNIALAMGGEQADTNETRQPSRETRRSLEFVRRSVDRPRRRLRLRKSASAPTAEPPLKRDAATPSETPQLQVVYLLISPLLPPVSLLATMFSRIGGRHLFLFNRSFLNTEHQEPIQPDEMLTSHPTLTIYGNKDIFTSRKKLRQWVGNLAARPKSMFQFQEIDGAGHFWQEERADERMRGSIRAWLQEISGDDSIMNSMSRC